MLSIIHQFLFYFHVTFGSVGLVVFWLPMLSKKGTAFHKKLGKVFTYSMFVVSISGIIMSVLVLMDPIGVRVPVTVMDTETTQLFIEQNRNTAIFLLMLSLLVFTNVKHSILALNAKGNRLLLRQYSHMIPVSILMLAGLGVGYLGISSGKTLFTIFSIIAILSSSSLFYYIFKKQLKKREWIIEHMGNIIGTGIGAYTGFFAFGGRRFLSEVFTGQLQLIPWMLPAVVGIAASVYLSKKYRLQYKVV